jgi:hypothetical protein
LNANDVLKYGHSFLLNAFDGLPEADWHTPGVCGVWSVKDIIAHLASYEGFLVEVLYDLLDQNQPKPLMESMVSRGPMGFNDYEVGLRQDQPVNTVLNEYNNAYAEVLALIDRVPVVKRRQAGVLPWYGAEYDFEDYIVYSFYGHKREHGGEIGVFRTRLAKGISS